MSVTLRQKTIRKGKEISFYLDIYNNGERWTESLGIYVSKNNQSASDKEKKLLAEQIRVKREKELLIDGHGLPNTIVKRVDFLKFFYELAIERKTCNTYISCYHKIVKYSKSYKLPFQAISLKWLRGFKDFLLSELSNNTARAYYIKLYASFEEAKRRKLLLHNPMDNLDRATDFIHEEKIERTAYTPNEIVKLAKTECEVKSKYNYAVPQYRMAYLFSCCSGLRWSDVNSLRWDSIEVFQNGEKTEYYLSKKQVKTQKQVLIPLGPNAIAILLERLEQRDLEPESPYVFPLVKEVDGTKRVWNRVKLYIRKWAKEAGFDPKKMHFHNSRHTFATNTLRYGRTELLTLSKLLGHHSLRSTLKYAQISTEMKQAAVNSMPVLDLKKSA